MGGKYDPTIDRRPRGRPEGRVNPYGLSRREMDVAKLSRLSRSEIARALGISPATVKAHFNRILAKMRIHSKWEIEDKLTAARREGEPMPEDLSLEDLPDGGVDEAEPTVSLTVTGPASRIRKLIDWLQRKP